MSVEKYDATLLLLSLSETVAPWSLNVAPPPPVEMEAMEHSLAVNFWVALGAFTFPLLFFVSAPYGKLVRDGWGGQFDGRLGWFLQEIPSPVTSPSRTRTAPGSSRTTAHHLRRTRRSSWRVSRRGGSATSTAPYTTRWCAG